MDFSCCHVRCFENRFESHSPWRDSYRNRAKSVQIPLHSSLFSLFLSLYYVKTARERSRARRFTQHTSKLWVIFSSDLLLIQRSQNLALLGVLSPISRDWLISDHSFCRLLVKITCSFEGVLRPMLKTFRNLVFVSSELSYDLGHHTWTGAGQVWPNAIR